MEQFLEVLRQAAIFMVAAKVILHFFPGNKYDRYGKIMTALIVLSMLVVPVLTFFKEDMGKEFWERAERLEAENEMFSQRLEGLSKDQESMVEDGIVLSVEEKVKSRAQEAGVSVRDVHIRDGTVVIEVEASAKKGGSDGISVEPVEVERIGLLGNGSAAKENGGAGETEGMQEESGSAVREDRIQGSSGAAAQADRVWDSGSPAAQADAGAVRGRRREDLARSFAAELGMEEGKVEVIER